MVGMIDLPEERIAANIQELRTCCTQLKQMSESIVSDIGILRGFWEGSAATAYLECANNMNKCVVTPMINLLNAYADAIDNGAHELTFNDSKTAKETTAQFGGITTISTVI